MVSHTNTGEWQSFEVRMLRKRAARLALRAEAAALEGCYEDAESCLAEARSLAPGLPEIAKAEAVLAESVAGNSVPTEEPAATPAAPEALPLTPVPARRRIPYSAVAVLAVLVLLALIAWPRNSGRPVETAKTTLMASEAVPATEPPPPAVEPIASAPSPAPAPSATPVPAATPASAMPGPAPSAPPVSTLGERTPSTLGESTPSTTVRGGDAIPAARTDRRVIDPTATGTTGAVRSSTEESATPAPKDEPTTRPAPLPVSGLPPAAPSLDIASPTVMAANVAPPAPASIEPPPDALVRAVLNRYAAAYSDLDVDAAAQVWPGVNRGALSRAFDSLSAQRVSLGNCRIDVAGTKAQARCAGTATWTPKVGAGTHTESRSWTFELARDAAAWQIVSARVQNR